MYICSCFHFSFLLLLPLLIPKVEVCILYRWHPNLVAHHVFTFLDHLFVQGRPLFQSSSSFDIVPCLQLVGISSCLRLCCHSISFSVDLSSFTHKFLVADFVRLYMTINRLYMTINRMYMTINRLNATSNRLYTTINRMYMCMTIKRLYMTINRMYMTINRLYMTIKRLYMTINLHDDQPAKCT